MILAPLNFVCLIWTVHLWYRGCHGQAISIFDEKHHLSRVVSLLSGTDNATWRNGLTITASPFAANDLFYNANAICRSLKNGSWVLIGLADTESANQLRWYSSALHVPVVLRSAYKQADFPKQSDAVYHFDVQPAIINAVLDIATAVYNWTEAFYITNSNSKNDGAHLVFDDNPGGGYLPHRLRALFFQMDSLLEAVNYVTATVLRSGIKDWRMILDIPADLARSLMMMLLSNLTVRERHFHFIIASLDAEGVDFELPQLTTSRLTILSMIQNISVTQPSKNLTTSDALAFDAVNFVLAALQRSNNSAVPSRSLNCTAVPYDVWSDGSAARQLLKTTVYSGLTGMLEFNDLGNRKNFELTIWERNDGGPFWKKGIWSDSESLQLFSEPEIQSNNTLRAVGIMTDRFLMIVPCNMTGSAKTMPKGPNANGTEECYIGYSVDFIDALSNITNYTFTLYNSSGKFYYGNQVDGTWTGAVGEILRKDADVVFGDLTVIAEREAVVDFTIPFMNDGFIILMKKDNETAVDVFGFLRPFSNNLWLSIVLAILGTFVVIFFVGRVGPSEWHRPEHCDPDEVEGITNDYTMEESLWLTVATLLQQGPNIEPRSVATKIAVGVWFIWALIISQTYTANLAAFLTLNRMDSSITSVRDLANQDNVRYGVLEANQASASFFAHSTQEIYQRMWNAMKHHHTGVEDVAEGVERVRNGGFAFIGPKSVVDYANQGRPCDTRVVGVPLFFANYALAVRRGSPLRRELSAAISRLHENGALDAMEKKWFTRDACQAVDEGDSQGKKDLDKLTPLELTGLFIILAAGLGIAMVLAIAEYLYKGHRKFRARGVLTQTIFLTDQHRKRRPMNIPTNYRSPSESHSGVSSLPSSRRAS
ncbi:glutamate receptor-like isoform X2 [Paramacrobiotus metropolitanus]|uniref:glutamate receptor-like isoform X2 n=1 Tax=Paramacrobiotus metropolitanus TaxID=2943436 RepID=UPI002445FB9A|nr:glutamate receptor-like isoform X2 [Paramacrobiotus metropolitanus]